MGNSPSKAGPTRPVLSRSIPATITVGVSRCTDRNQQLRRLRTPDERLPGSARGARPVPGVFSAGDGQSPGTPRQPLDAAVASAYSRISAPGSRWESGCPAQSPTLLPAGLPIRCPGAMTGTSISGSGSITKTFTVTAILQLADEGRLSSTTPWDATSRLCRERPHHPAHAGEHDERTDEATPRTRPGYAR